MRLLVLFAGIFLVALPDVQGQTLAFAGGKSTVAAMPLLTAQYLQKDHRAKLSSETKTGFWLSGTGLAIGITGIALYDAAANDYDASKKQQTAAGVWLVGGVVGILGSIFAIDGGKRDMHKFYHEKTFGIISNKPNEVGVAFNF